MSSTGGARSFSLHNMINESKERISDWLTTDPNNPEHRARIEALINEQDLRKCVDPQGKLTEEGWNKAREEIYRNYSEIARIQLLFSFREIPEPVIQLIRETAAAARTGVSAPPPGEIAGPRYNPNDRPAYSDRDLAMLDKMIEDARSETWADKQLKEYPKVVQDIYRAGLAKARASAQDAAQRARWQNRAMGWFHNWVLAHLGLMGPDHPGPFAEFSARVGLGEVDTRLTSHLSKYKMLGPERVLRHAVLDWGTAMAFMDIARAYAESNGDMEVAEKTAAMQLVYMFPLVGPLGSIVMAPDWRTRAIAITCLMVPQAGAVQMAFALGENGGGDLRVRVHPADRRQHGGCHLPRLCRADAEGVRAACEAVHRRG